MAKILDVGNCSADHNRIRSMLVEHFDVQIDRVMFVAEALDRLKREKYDLVLVNRRIFDDDSDGLPLVTHMQADAALRKTPVMMISNLPDAQQAAVAAGAVPGFGKAAVSSPASVALLAKYLPPRKVAAAN